MANDLEKRAGATGIVDGPKGHYERQEDAITDAHAESREGSCALVAGACIAPDGNSAKAHTANLGDSTAFVLVYGKDGNKKIHLLNALHEPGNSKEEARVRGEGGIIRYGRLMSDFAHMGVTSSIGDTGFKGLGQVPEYRETDIPLEEGEKVFLIVACDGMTEQTFRHDKVDSSHEEGIQAYSSRAADFIDEALTPEDFTNFTPKVVASKLLKKSVENGSGDNISILVQEIHSDVEPVLMAVFDGHGGDEQISFQKGDRLPVLQPINPYLVNQVTFESRDTLAAALGKEILTPEMQIREDRLRSTAAIDKYILDDLKQHSEKIA